MSINSVVYDSHRREAAGRHYTLTKEFNNSSGMSEWVLRHQGDEWRGDEEWAHRIADHYGMLVPECTCKKEKVNNNGLPKPNKPPIKAWKPPIICW